ncbi:MAG TPA: N-acetylmuramoyl-L-alanine amidase [Dermatophilaceae bacterium]
MRTCSPDYSRTLKVGFVHHTVTSNNYAPSDSAGIVRGIYAYHVNGNGWCDIGYNFLVDQYGQTFEGRFGGMDRPVIGAQAGGFNTDTFGVAALGTFTTATPPAAMLASIGRVLGWKLGLHGRNARGSAVLTSGGGPYTQYPAGTPVMVGVVSGHRDVDLTECPGNALYAQIPALRYQAASYAAWNTTRDEDLYGIFGTTGWAPSGTAEIHAQSMASNYTQRLLDAATRWSAGNPGQWRFFMGSSSVDTRPDLIGVQTTGTASGKVEVKVASWASHYQDTVVQTTTPMNSFPADSTIQMAVGGPSGGDLYFVIVAGTGSGTTEIHALSAASNYTGWSVHSASALPTGYATTQVRFLVARGTGDLYLVLHSNTGSGRSEMHALSAASGYRSFSVHAALSVGYTNDSGVQWVLGTAASPDLFFLQLLGTGTQRVEAHKLSAAANYGAWAIHSTTDLPQIQYPVWQFSAG